MDTQKKAYRIFVSTPNGNALVFCVSFPLTSDSSTFALEFYELMWSHQTQVQEIPSSRQTTFKEELHIWHKAYSSRTADSDEKNVIVGLMKDAYGNDSTVHLSSVDHLLPQREV